MSLSEDLIIGERKFLHELTNHIVVAQGMSVIALKKIKTSELDGLDPNIIDKLEKSLVAMDKIVLAVRARRDELLSRVESI